ncbi:MAG: ArsA-related P-loop ATPase [Actinomycetota bacterium]
MTRRSTSNVDPDQVEPVPSNVDAVDRILAEAQVVVMSGPGGVGKTTTAAALGLRAATVHQRRVVVVTVDPARRLAEALGVARLTEEPVLVPVGGGDGRLWVLMVDMAKSWDELVVRHAPDPTVSEQLLANRLYRTLTRRFVQSHDYIALDHLLLLAEQDRYDLVIVDTPPSRHALDLFDAPGRMIEFFESRLLRWLTAGTGLTSVAAKPFLAVAQRLLGDDFLTQIVDFFTLFAKLRPAFVARARAVGERLEDETTTYAVVTTTDPLVAEGCQDLIDELARRGLIPGLLVLNRFPPTLRLRRVEDTDGTDGMDSADGQAGIGGTGGGASAGYVVEPAMTEADVAAIEDPELAAAVTDLVTGAGSARVPDVGEPSCPVVTVPWSAVDLADLDGLAALFPD